MTRLPKLFAVLLALALGASGGVASLAACPHASAVAATTHARHDCCHAAHGHAHSMMSGEMGEHAAREATDIQTSGAPAMTQQADGCAASRNSSAAHLVSVSDDGSPCAGCCAERAAASPRAVVATNARKSSHSTDARDKRESQSFALTTSLHTDFAPTQHAPPAVSARLHVLINVFLI